MATLTDLNAALWSTSTSRPLTALMTSFLSNEQAGLAAHLAVQENRDAEQARSGVFGAGAEQAEVAAGRNLLHFPEDGPGVGRQEPGGGLGTSGSDAGFEVDELVDVGSDG